MPPVPPRRRRARPVADAPIDSLLPRSEDLARGWLLALLEQAPLDAAPGILAADLVHDGPRVCEAVLRAITNDSDLHRLQRGGSLRSLAARAGELAGAVSPEAASQAVDALQAVLWSAIRDELRGPDADLVAAVTERLALVAEVVRGAALASPAQGVRRPEPEPRPAPEPDRAARPQRPVHPAAARPGDSSQRVWPKDPAASAAPGPLWVGALEEEIRASAGSPLSLLLVELEDADRVSAARGPDEASETFHRFAAAVRSAVRRQDILVCESEARAWIIARDTTRTGAHSLGERIAGAVEDSQPWQGAPLRATVGVAVLGEDGRTTAELIDAAEEARFAAAARGVPLVSGNAGDREGPDAG